MDEFISIRNLVNFENLKVVDFLILDLEFLVGYKQFF